MSGRGGAVFVRQADQVLQLLEAYSGFFGQFRAGNAPLQGGEELVLEVVSGVVEFVFCGFHICGRKTYCVWLSVVHCSLPSISANRATDGQTNASCVL
jgi:hypothetical protein